MEATTATREPWTFAQKGIVALASLQLLWALAGFIAEPSFHLGANAPTERVLYYAIYAAGALIVTGIWALFDHTPAWIFTFPNNDSDAIFHLATGALFAIVAVIQIARDRTSP